MLSLSGIDPLLYQIFMSGYSDEYKEYSMGLALLDMVPVFLFFASGLIMYSMYGSKLLLAGVLASFTGGLCKAIWKMIVAVSEKDFSEADKAEGRLCRYQKF